MNKELNARICECYNYNVGTALNLLFNCIDTESNFNRLEAAKKLIKREIELERVEYWVDFSITVLDRYFDDLDIKINFSKNIHSAIYEIYGGFFRL